MVENTCPVIRKDGQQCRGTPGPSGLCWAHSPDTAEKREEARRRGGQGKSTASRAQRLLSPDLQRLDLILDGAIAAVVKGNIAPTQASAIASLASCKIRLRELGLKQMEALELKERIQRLEEAINVLNLKSNRNGAYRGTVHR
jgi:hypothetical protein